MKESINFRHHNKIQSVYEKHRSYFTPELRVFTVVTLLSVFILVCFSVYLHPSYMEISYNFTREEGSITILSSTTLSIASLLAYACFFTNFPAKKRQRIFFLIIALALTYLVIDEVTNLHEHIGKAIDTYPTMTQIANSLHVSTWSDMILIIYGITALPLLFYFLPTALRIPCIPEYFLAAIVCFVIHISIDFIADPPTDFSYIVEESLKVYISTFLALGLFSGLVFLINTNRERM